MHDQGVIVEANQRVADLFGFERARELVGTSFKGLFTSETVIRLGSQANRGEQRGNRGGGRPP